MSEIASPPDVKNSEHALGYRVAEVLRGEHAARAVRQLLELAVERRDGEFMLTMPVALARGLLAAFDAAAEIADASYRELRS